MFPAILPSGEGRQQGTGWHWSHLPAAAAPALEGTGGRQSFLRACAILEQSASRLQGHRLRFLKQRERPLRKTLSLLHCKLHGAGISPVLFIAASSVPGLVSGIQKTSLLTEGKKG